MAKTAETTSKNGFAEVAKAFDMTKAFDIGKAFDMSKAFGEMKLPGIDVEAGAASQRKNLAALNQGNPPGGGGPQPPARAQYQTARPAAGQCRTAVPRRTR